MSSNKSTRRVHRGRRQRILLSRIENDAHRNDTFSKRLIGLFKKGSEISTLCGVEMLLVVFSPNKKNVYTFGSPNVNVVLDKYVAESDENRTIEANVSEKLLRSQKEADIRLANHQINVLEAAIQHEMKVNEALTEAAKGMPSISNLPLAELLSMKRQMEILRSNVFQILNPQPTMQGMTTQCDDVNPSGATPF